MSSCSISCAGPSEIMCTANINSYFLLLKTPLSTFIVTKTKWLQTKSPSKTNKQMKGHESSKITMLQVYFGNALGRAIWKLLLNELLPSFKGTGHK